MFQRYSEALPPNSPEAERGILGCCLLDATKVLSTLKAGVTGGCFFDRRHREIFGVLAGMALDRGGDALLATMILREQGKLDAIGGPLYLAELQNTVPSAENIGYYIPELLDRFRRRQVLDAATRLEVLARNHAVDSAAVLSDTTFILELLRNRADTKALPDIVSAPDFLDNEILTPTELVAGVLHQGSKLILGGASKTYKTWTLTDLAISVATGTPWLGFDTAPGKVLYVNLEIQPAFFRRRMREVLEARQVELDGSLQIWNLRGYTADYRTLLPKIQERIQGEAHALVILDPTYKLLGIADENNATDVADLLNTIENLAMSTGAAVAMAGHFSKGNASAKETIDRISGSGVFARDPDSLLIFTKHEEEGAFTVEPILRNFPPVKSFVAQWRWPRFYREDGLDPSRLKSSGGRPAKHKSETLLECLGDQRLKTIQWSKLASSEFGIPNGSFFLLLKQLTEAKKVSKSPIDGKWCGFR